MMRVKCPSCREGYNGRDGNGYQPCGCVEKGTDRGRMKVRVSYDGILRAVAVFWIVVFVVLCVKDLFGG